MPQEARPSSQANRPPVRLISTFRFSGLLRQVVGSLGLKMCAAGIGFVNSVLLARILGPSELGVYSIVLSIVNFSATIAVLGLPVLSTREVAAKVEQEAWGKLKGIVNSAHRLTLLATSIILLLAIFLFLLVSPSEQTWIVTLIGMLLVPLIAFNQLRAAILRGMHWVILADVPELFIRPVLMLLMLVLITYTTINVNANHALGIQLVAVFIALVVGTWWLKTRQPEQLKRSIPETSGRILIGESIPFLTISLVNILQGQVTLYMLGYIGGAGQAGLYFAASQLVGLIVIGLVAVNLPLQPRLATAWAQNNKKKLQSLVTEAARLGTGIALIGLLVMIVFPEFMLHVYGSKYVEASTTLKILAFGQMFNAITGSGNILLMMTGHQNVVARGTVLALIVNAGFGYLIIPKYGVEGGAVATVMGICCWNIYYVIYSIKKLGVNVTVFRAV